MITFSITILSIAIKCHNQRNIRAEHYTEVHYAECNYSECMTIFSITECSRTTLSITIKCETKHNITLNFAMISTMMSVIILNV